MAQDSTERLTKNQRREQAREQARVAREQEKKREKRRKTYIQGGVVLGVIAVLAVVALILTQSLKPAGPGPRNMASGGFVIGKDLKLQKTAALQDGEKRVAPETDRSKTPLDVTIYLDYSCIHCEDFEKTNSTVIDNWAGSGDAQFEFYPVPFQDTAANNRHSTRAANLQACVVDSDPADGVAMKLHTALFSEETYQQGVTSGLSDEDMYQLAENAGANVDTKLKQCIKNVQFGEFIAQNAQAAGSDGVLGLAKGQTLSDGQGGQQDADGPQKLRGTPLIIVNGKEWVSQTGDFTDFEQHLLKVKSELEQQNATDEDAETDADTKSDTKSKDADSKDSKKSE